MPGFQTDAGTVQQEAGFGFDGRFWCESYADNLIAFPGGGRTSATKLTSMYNRVATVASAGDSVVLPPIGTKVGLTIGVVNDGASTMQVFADGTDSVSGVAGATGVGQMQSSVVYYTAIKPGTWHAQGLGCGFFQSYPTFSSIDALTAAGTNQGNAAAAQTATIARYTTVAAGTGALLPAAKTGMEYTVCNAGANAILVYAAPSTDVINATSNATGFSIAVGKAATFYCTANGQWHTLVSA